MSQTEFRFQDQQLVEHLIDQPLLLMPGSRLTIDAEPYEVQSLGAEIKYNEAIQIFYVKPLEPKLGHQTFQDTEGDPFYAEKPPDEWAGS